MPMKKWKNMLSLFDSQSWKSFSHPQRQEEEERKETQKRQVCVYVCVIANVQNRGYALTSLLNDWV